jgi:large conductance mechanosensitive channel
MKFAANTVKEFKAFISRGNVIDLAVGIIMGAAFTAIVTSLVQDVIMPPIGWVMGGLDFSSFFVALNGESYASLKAAQDAGAPTINYGLFINAIIKFLIVSWAVFWLVKVVSRIKRAEEAAPSTPPAPARSEVLLEEIRDLLAKK